MEFYATGINKFISIGKNLLIVTVPILINKYDHVFESGYNDLKIQDPKLQLLLHQSNSKLNLSSC